MAAGEGNLAAIGGKLYTPSGDIITLDDSSGAAQITIKPAAADQPVIAVGHIFGSPAILWRNSDATRQFAILREPGSPGNLYCVETNDTPSLGFRVNGDTGPRVAMGIISGLGAIVFADGAGGGISALTRDNADQLTLTNAFVRAAILGGIVTDTTDRTLSRDDFIAGVVKVNAATTKTVTVPTNAAVTGVPIGAPICVVQDGAGSIVVAGSGGVTINCSSSQSLTLATQHASLTLIKVATNTWDLVAATDGTTTYTFATGYADAGLALKAPIASPTLTGVATAPAFAVSGLTGAVNPARLVGATTTGAAPTTGTFAVGDFVISIFAGLVSGIFVCTSAGSPGTWVGLTAFYAPLSSPALTGSPTTTSLAATGAVTSSGGKLGYATGAGGTVTQGTSRTTTVSLSKLSGTITLFTATLAADTDVSFTWTNTFLAAGDVVVFNVIGGAAVKAGYSVNCIAGAGTATVTVHNVTPTISASEAPQLGFVVIKGVTS